MKRQQKRARRRRWPWLVGGVGAGFGVGVAAAGTRRPRPVTVPQQHAVTIHRSIDDLAPGGTLPEPLGTLADGGEVDVRPAPGDWGTEVRVTAPRGTAAGDLREALREAKQKLETGEVLRLEHQPAGRGQLSGRVTAVAHRQLRRGGRG